MTKAEFVSGFGQKGTLNASQFYALGYKKSFFKGWRKSIPSRLFTETQIKKYVKLCDHHLKHPEENKRLRKKGLAESKKKKRLFDKQGSTTWQYGKPQWHLKRNSILIRDNYTCQLCGERCTKEGYMVVHHLLYERGKYVWEVPDICLVTLCPECHKDQHSRDFIPPPKHF